MEVTCSGWLSSSGQLSYEVTYRSGELMVVVYRGPRPTATFILPVGQQEVVVGVVDQSGVKTLLEPFFLEITESEEALSITEMLNSNEYRLALQQINAQAATQSG